MPTTDSMTIHLVDDDEGVRVALDILLTEAGYRVKTYESGNAFLGALETAGPGCIVSDIRMPGIDGLQLQQRLKTERCTLPIIFITGHGDIQMAVQAMRAGASDFIEKPFEDTALLDAIARCLKSVAAHTPSVASEELRRRLAALSPREKEVLDCMALGKPNKITAYELGISVRTVEIHRARVMEKMQARSLSELVRLVLSVQDTSG